MKKILYLLPLLSACSSGPELDPLVEKLIWLENANPSEDARVALRQNDYRLLGLSNRGGLKIPAVRAEDRYFYENKCGVNIMQGVTDFAVNQHHQELMRKAHSYALQYNAMIKPECKRRSQI